MVAGKTQIATAAAVAAVALAGSAYAAPTGETQQLAARTNKIAVVAGQVAKDTLHGKVVDAAHGKLKDKIGYKSQPFKPRQQAAIDRTSGLDHRSIVANALGHLPKTRTPQHERRSLEDALWQSIARAYYDEGADELVTRMNTVVKIVGQVVKDNLHGKIVDAVNDKIKDTFGSKPQPLSPQLQHALDQAKGPHHPSVVAAAIGHSSKNHKTRDFDLDDALFARIDNVVKVLGQDVKVVDAALTPQQQAAINRASGPHHPSTVASALGQLPKTPQSGHKKRYLEDEIYEIFARGFELDDLE